MYPFDNRTPKVVEVNRALLERGLSVRVFRKMHGAGLELLRRSDPWSVKRRAPEAWAFACCWMVPEICPDRLFRACGLPVPRGRAGVGAAEPLTVEEEQAVAAGKALYDRILDSLANPCRIEPAPEHRRSWRGPVPASAEGGG